MKARSEYTLRLADDVIGSSTSACTQCLGYQEGFCKVDTRYFSCNTTQHFVLAHEITGVQVDPEEIVKLHRNKKNDN